MSLKPLSLSSSQDNLNNSLDNPLNMQDIQNNHNMLENTVLLFKTWRMILKLFNYFCVFTCRHLLRHHVEHRTSIQEETQYDQSVHPPERA